MSENARVTAGRGQLYNSILDTIGNTPCVRVKKGVPEDVRLYVKAEFFNPFFTKLAGQKLLQEQIEMGMTADQIRDSWKTDLERYKLLRVPYLLYPL